MRTSFCKHFWEINKVTLWGAFSDVSFSVWASPIPFPLIELPNIPTYNNLY
jgi:hypothetical protein